MHNSQKDSGFRHSKRLRAEKRFRLFGQSALGTAVVILIFLIGSLVWRGAHGFMQTQIRLPITFDAGTIGVTSSDDVNGRPPAVYQRLAGVSLKGIFPEVVDPVIQKELLGLVSVNAGRQIKKTLEENPALLSKAHDIWLPSSSAVDLFLKGSPEEMPENMRAWIKTLQEKSLLRSTFNPFFFTKGDSRNPEQAGFLGGIVGSLFTLLSCLMVAVPLGVMTAVYLEEFARKSRWVTLIEVNVNNLAAVPSIVFGLLGLAVYINMMHLPRSSALVGGITLALMILPVIIIATRAALASIPLAIRDAARALGATPLQVVWHHVLPLAMPGIMTGTILGMARAIGETAPLILIGMVAFVADIPSGFTSPATVMPVQIYLWANSAEAGFAEKTAAGILVLLVIMLLLNALAIVLRKKFEIRW